MQIVTFYPGASPEVMASSVTAPLERQFGQVPGLQQMTSTSSDGSSVITLQFSLSLNIDIAEQEVQQAINASGTYLPADLPNPPIYSKTNPADAPIMTLGADLRHDAALADRGPGRHAAGAEDLAGLRRRPRQHQRRPEAGRAHPGQPDRALLLRHQPGGHPQRHLRRQRQPGQGQLRRPRASLPDRRERPAARQRRLREPHRRLQATARRCGSPTSPTSSTRPRTTSRPRGPTRRPAIILNIQRQPGANIIARGRQHQQAAAEAAADRCPPRSRSPPCPTAPGPSAPRSPT